MKKYLYIIVLFSAMLNVSCQKEIVINTRVLPGTITPSEVMIYWDKPIDYQDVNSYDIYCNDNKIGRSNKNNFRVTELEPQQEYRIAVKVVYNDNDVVETPALIVKTFPKGQVHNIHNFGAKANEGAVNTKAIQAAIDACKEYDEIFIPKGEYITGALFINKSNVSVHMEEGAMLKASLNLDDFPIIKTRYEGRLKDAYASVLNIGNMDKGERYNNIRLYGKGIIDGQGSVLADKQTEARDRMARAHGLPIINCDSVAIDGLTIQNPCTWNVHPIYCKGTTTNNTTILSDNMGLSNADGWDPDSSTDCYLINSLLETHDDHIAIKSGVDAEGREVGIFSENIYVSHCHFKHGGGLAVGSEMSGGVRNVWFEDCTIENSDRGFHIKSRPGRGGLVENVYFRDIKVEHTGGWGISVDTWYYVDNHIVNSRKDEELPEFRNIFFENIHIKNTKGNPIQVIGLVEKPIKNVVFKNITIDNSEHKVLLRNCENISFQNVDIGDKYWVEDNAKDIKIDKKTSPQKQLVYDYKLVDPNATYATKALFHNLKKTSKTDSFFFGQQDATSSGYGWSDDSGRSDIQDIAGVLPALYSWDYMDFTRPNVDNTKSENKIRKLTSKAFYQGGINSYCWHFWNPITQGSFYDTTHMVVREILPKGTHHEVYKKELQNIVRYNSTLTGKYGEQIPIIFRPYHEFDGSWFWWGANHCTAAEYKELYRFTVTYLRDTLEVRNFLYAFSPDCKFKTKEEYLERYPGDEYVDILGMDNYWDFKVDRNDLDMAHQKLLVISDLAKERNKVAALTETGQSKVENPQWYTECLLKTIYGYSDKIDMGYVALWRNSVRGYYTPFEGHPAVSDFLKFTRSPHVIMGTKKGLNGIYDF